ncbi:MAG: TlpA family protein disulfide reductase [Deltaproteobacteria bacterium]|nr:TlpA family protein disulfide reductase [Deltaproteobacteria bacterium]
MNASETRPGPSLKLSLTILFVVIASVLVILLLRNGRDSTTPTTKQIQVGFPAPNFIFPDLKGQQISLSDQRGKVVLVNIWATWCPPCKQEMPSMQKLYEKFKGENFEILAVSIDSTGRDAVAPFTRTMNLTFPVLLDPNEDIGSLYGITGVPESFIIDKEGIVVEKIIGPIDWATPKVFQFFQDLINKPKS